VLMADLNYNDFRPVTAVTSATVFDVTDATGISAGTYYAWVGFTSTVKWAAKAAGNPGAMHMWRDAAAIFGSINGAYKLTWSFTTDRYTSAQTATQFVEYENPLSGYLVAAADSPRSFRVPVPRNCKRAMRVYPQLSSRTGIQAWKLHGLSLVFQPMSERFDNAT
jgi:hypothetical protein